MQVSSGIFSALDNFYLLKNICSHTGLQSVEIFRSRKSNTIPPHSFLICCELNVSSMFPIYFFSVFFSKVYSRSSLSWTRKWKQVKVPLIRYVLIINLVSCFLYTRTWDFYLPLFGTLLRSDVFRELIAQHLILWQVTSGN